MYIQFYGRKAENATLRCHPRETQTKLDSILGSREASARLSDRSTFTRQSEAARDSFPRALQALHICTEFCEKQIFSMLQDCRIQTRCSWYNISSVRQELHQGPGDLDGMLSQHSSDFIAWTLSLPLTSKPRSTGRSCLSLLLKHSHYSSSP